ncbi:MAG TPA: prephenate dehydrogenase/arogenate dehydrogenase family protein [Blastocatellia bacterium]|nr:prephenate dehydrogenase/arogenate dehydrogenase family protein [Blastocatellia bacterium]
MHNLQHITIVGCGLIGGSFALALRRAGFKGRITTCGGKRGPALAVEREIADAIEESFDRGEVCNADLIYLAAPIGGIIDFLKTRGTQIKAGAIVTDAGSTKAEISRVARESLPTGVTFIGGHPMAGSEHTGLEYARADLFDRATYALTFESDTDEDHLNQLKQLIEAIGARLLVTQPDAHDAAVALISHLPQLTSTALAVLLDKDQTDLELARWLAATGWRDMTRLAGSSWSVWRDICLTNQPNIITVLNDLISELQNLKDALEQRDYNYARALFETANEVVARQRALQYHQFERITEKP